MAMITLIEDIKERSTENTEIWVETSRINEVIKGGKIEIKDSLTEGLIEISDGLYVIQISLSHLAGDEEAFCQIKKAFKRHPYTGMEQEVFFVTPEDAYAAIIL